TGALLLTGHIPDGLATLGINTSTGALLLTGHIPDGLATLGINTSTGALNFSSKVVQGTAKLGIKAATDAFYLFGKLSSGDLFIDPVSSLLRNTSKAVHGFSRGIMDVTTVLLESVGEASQYHGKKVKGFKKRFKAFRKRNVNPLTACLNAL
ncbi:MAG: hypothetical protein K2P90_02145, partial [Holosporales bacterium]|nr:hypothetical protein [Holosporales bacterium]